MNEEHYIVQCLESIVKQSYKDHEIVVVDGESSDRTVELAEKYADKVIVRKGSVGVARNLGAKNSRGSILAFIDADTVAHPCWLDAVDESFRKGEFIAATGPTLPLNGDRSDEIYYRIATIYVPKLLLILGTPYMGGFNCAYERNAFFRAGGFDEENIISEEAKLSFNIKRLGKVTFNDRMITFTSPRRMRRYGHIYMGVFYVLNSSMIYLRGRSLRKYPRIR